MEYTKVKGIVLQSFDYKDKDKLVKIFSLEEGIVTATLKGVKGANAKLKATKEPFCFADFILEKTSNRIISANIIDSFYDLTKDIKKMYCACMMLDAVKIILKENQTNSQLFVNLLKALKVITYDNVNLYYVLDKFLIEIFAFNGLKLSFDKCSNCGIPLKGKRYLNLNYSEIVCISCRTGRVIEISPVAHKSMQILNEMQFDDLKNVKLPENSEIDVYKILSLNFENQFGVKLTTY